jgi:hypothetical protein
MTTQDNYTSLNETVTFENGKSFNLYSKPTKKGVRYFYWSSGNMRYMPISKNRIGIA